MSSLPSPLVSRELYLELDSQAEVPSEFYDGVMYPIVATSMRHSVIQLNVAGSVRQALRGSSCQTLGSTVRVRLPNHRYAYPDLLVVCGKIELEKYDTVLNPVVIVEILSPSTGDFDRGGKADLYRAMATVRDYVIIAQDRLLVQRYTRQPGEKWLLEIFESVDAVLRLESIGVAVPLSEIYERVDFDSVE